MRGGEHTALGFPNWTLDTLRLYLINILGDRHDAIDDDDDGIDGDHHHHMQGWICVRTTILGSTSLETHNRCCDDANSINDYIDNNHLTQHTGLPHIDDDDDDYGDDDDDDYGDGDCHGDGDDDDDGKWMKP